MYNTLVKDDILKIIVSSVQHNDPLNNKQDGSLADTYGVCESCDFTIRESQYAFTKVAVILWAKATYIVMGEAPNLEEHLLEQAGDGECQASVQRVGRPVSCYP